MRTLGWHAETYLKVAHELLKLLGSRWYTELGAEAAQSWLGHFPSIAEISKLNAEE